MRSSVRRLNPKPSNTTSNTRGVGTLSALNADAAAANFYSYCS
jgi:hypothetical protein